jgi:hypothetical protein
MGSILQVCPFAVGLLPYRVADQFLLHLRERKWFLGIILHIAAIPCAGPAGADLSLAKLTGAHFVGADLGGVHLRDADPARRLSEP